MNHLRSFVLFAVFTTAFASSIADAHDDDMPQLAEADKTASTFAVLLLRAVRLIDNQHVNRASQSEMVRWAIEGLFADCKEPIPAQLRESLGRLPKMTAAEMSEVARQARFHFQERQRVGGEKALKIAVTAILAKLEPGSPENPAFEYTTAEELRKMPNGEERSNDVGVGLKLERDRDSGCLRVVTPIPGGPAHKAGIGAGDLVTHIVQKEDTEGNPHPRPIRLSTKLLGFDEAEVLLRGMSGTAVSVIIERK